MKLDLGEIVLHLGKRIRYDIDEPPIDELPDGMKCVEPIQGEAVFSNAGKHVVVRGHFSTKVQVDCVRCLNKFDMDLDLPIEEELPIAGHTLEMIADGEAELPEDSLEPLFEDNVLNLTELLRQDIIVAVPIKPLCDELCKGLCSRCGHDLNQGSCECLPEEGNTLFSELASLLVDEDENEDKSKS